MLKRIYIKNFALIDKLDLELGSGFDVLTGETGAGKSILIDAVGIICGNIAATEYIRSGENKALVEGVFDCSNNLRLREVLAEYGLLPDDDEDLVLTRDIVRTGKNTCRINGNQISLSSYKKITANLIDIYGQNQQQSLLNIQKHLELLDAFGGEKIASIKNQLTERYNDLLQTKTKIENLQATEKENLRMLDVYRFQLDEIEKADLNVNEEETLLTQRVMLSNADKLERLCNTAYELLFEGGRQDSAIDLLQQSLGNLRELVHIDPSIDSVHQAIEAASIQIEEATRDLKDYAMNIEADPMKLEETNARIEMVNKLKKKYGSTIQEILDYKQEVATALQTAENFETELTDAAQAYQEAKHQYDILAKQLSAMRRNVADRLKATITIQLKELEMPYVTFNILFREKHAGKEGIDEVEYYISPNKGEELKPLAKIASGGEMSRIMLAFKSVMAEFDNISTLIFDEVDAGIGGNALNAVANKLAQIGRSRQVICVTHAPQLAGYAKNHYRVLKFTENERTRTSVQLLNQDERIDEISRMLSGSTASEVTRKHAQEILKNGLLVN